MYTDGGAILSSINIAVLTLFTVIHPFWEHLKDMKIYAAIADTATNPEMEPGPEDEDFPEIVRLKELTLSTHLNDTEREANVKAVDELHRTFKRVRKCSFTENRHGAMVGTRPLSLIVMTADDI